MIIREFFAGLHNPDRRAMIEGRGHTYITYDIEPSFNCDHTGNIMDIDDPGRCDLAWASVPCETWSVASVSHHWKDGRPISENAKFMVRLVAHTIDLLNRCADMWVIENPRGMLRKHPLMHNIKRQTVTYCQYGETRMKPTDIWTSGFTWYPRPMCKNGDPCHEAAPRGSRTGTQGISGYSNRSIVPLQLWEEILSAAEGTQKIETVQLQLPTYSGSTTYSNLE